MNDLSSLKWVHSGHILIFSRFHVDTSAWRLIFKVSPNAWSDNGKAPGNPKAPGNSIVKTGASHIDPEIRAQGVVDLSREYAARPPGPSPDLLPRAGRTPQSPPAAHLHRKNSVAETLLSPADHDAP